MLCVVAPDALRPQVLNAALLLAFARLGALGYQPVQLRLEHLATRYRIHPLGSFGKQAGTAMDGEA